MEVTYSELIIGKKIGQGACSTVNMARHVHTGEIFAVKMFNVYDEVKRFSTF
jgi:serine/threonine protein kinase